MTGCQYCHGWNAINPAGPKVAIGFPFHEVVMNNIHLLVMIVKYDCMIWKAIYTGSTNCFSQVIR